MAEDKKVGVGFGVMILKNNQILLGHRHSDAQKADSAMHGEGSWTMPGGKLHFQENPEDGACREVMEETGLTVAKENLKLISISNDKVSDAHFITFGFLCEIVDGEAQVMEPDEIVEWKWYDLDNLPTPMFFPSQRVLDNYLAKTIYTPAS